MTTACELCRTCAQCIAICADKALSSNGVLPGDLYRFFVHQAVLAGTILTLADYRELRELPYLMNYPLHIHAQYPADRRPASTNETRACRYDVFFEEEGWERGIAIHEPLSSWLAANAEGGDRRSA